MMALIIVALPIRLPEPQILSASLDEAQTDVYDKDFSFPNIRPDDLVEKARAVALDRIGEAEREDGIRSFVTTLALGFKKVESFD